MPSSKGRISSSRRKPARSFTTTRRSCSRTATDGSARSRRTSPSTRRTGKTHDEPLRAFLLSLRHGGGGVRLHGDRVPQSGAFGAVPHSRLRQFGGVIRAGGRGISRDDPDRRLCRRGRGVVSLRRDDARCRFCRAAPRVPAISAGRRDRGVHFSRGIAADRRNLDHRRGCRGRDPLADSAGFRGHQYAGARPRALYDLRALFRARRPRAPGGDDRRHRADAASQAERQAPEHRRAERPLESERDGNPKSAAGAGDLTMTIGLSHYLTVGAILFTLGILGIFLNRKNVIVILMSIELILLAVNINLVAFSAFLGDIVGQIYALIVLTVAAAEAAIGLAILVVFYRNRGSIAVEDINMMKG